MPIEKKKELLIDIALVISICGICYVFFKYIFVYTIPFIIGLILTLIVEKPARTISRKIKLKKNFFSVVLVLLLYAFIVGIIMLIGYGLYNTMDYLIQKIPEFAPTITEFLNNTNEKFSEVFKNMPVSITNAISDMPEKIITSITNKLTILASTELPNLISLIPKIVITIIITFVGGGFIAKDYDKLKNALKRHINPTTWDKLLNFKKFSIDKMIKILQGYLILMAITFFELTIGLTIIGAKNSFILALIIAIVDIFPILGVGTVLIPWGIICAIIGNSKYTIGLFILYIIITIVRNIMEPKIIGKQIGLPPIITLCAMYIGLKLFGFIGMIGFPIIITIGYALYQKSNNTTSNFRSTYNVINFNKRKEYLNGKKK